jgi:hypothetical protein
MTPLKPIVLNDTLLPELFVANEVLQETLVDAEDIHDEDCARDFLDTAELEEEIEEAANQILVDHQLSDEEIKDDWNTRTSLVLDSSKDALARRTLSGYERYKIFQIYLLTFE